MDPTKNKFKVTWLYLGIRPSKNITVTKMQQKLLEKIKEYCGKWNLNAVKMKLFIFNHKKKEKTYDNYMLVGKDVEEKDKVKYLGQEIPIQESHWKSRKQSYRSSEDVIFIKISTANKKTLYDCEVWRNMDKMMEWG